MSDQMIIPHVRPAQPGDSDSMIRCFNAAFTPYIERIGKPPAPMLLNYPSLIEAGQAWVAEINRV